MQDLINFLLQYDDLNGTQIDLIKSSASVIELKPDEYFSVAGKIPNKVGFVSEGILRVCYYNNEGDEITKYFVDENNFVVDYNSFSNQIPSTEYIQAIVPTQLYVFSVESLQNLSNTILSWDAMMNKIVGKALMEKVQRISPMLSEDAKTRYLEFHKRFPSLVNRIPLNYLASYIGITKHSLSRIRKQIAF